MIDRLWIAQQVHEVVRGLDPQQPAWEDAPTYMRDATVAGVNACLDNGADAAESHATWCNHMRADGWVHGDSKDIEAKTHPCLIDYEDLAELHKAKDRVFVSTVKSLYASLSKRPAPVVHSDMATLLSTQYTLQDRVGTWDKIKGDPASRQQFINQMFLAIQDEIMEAMHETQWKHPDLMPHGWKRGQTSNPDGFRKELIDVLHVWLALALVAGLDAETIMSEYMSKCKINHVRQETGY